MTMDATVYLTRLPDYLTNDNGVPLPILERKLFTLNKLLDYIFLKIFSNVINEKKAEQRLISRLLKEKNIIDDNEILGYPYNNTLLKNIAFFFLFFTAHHLLGAFLKVLVKTLRYLCDIELFLVGSRHGQNTVSKEEGL